MKIIALIVFFLGIANVASAQACSEIRFAPGASYGDVSGRVTDNEPQCFRFGAGAGQTARVQIFGNENVCFTIPGVVDCQADYSFRTEQSAYQVEVYQLFRALDWEQYTMRLSIQ